MAGRWYLPLVMLLVVLSTVPTLLVFALGAAALGGSAPAVAPAHFPTETPIAESCPAGQPPEVPEVGPGW